MTTYRYVLCDLLTDQVLAQLPLTGVTFDRRISRTGSLQGTLVAPNARLVALGKLAHAYAGRSALWVYRDQELWWGGIPWTVTAEQDARGPVSVSITAATFDSYAHHRRLYADATFTAVDQGVIIPNLWRTIQANSSGNIGVVAEDQPTGVLRDRVYLVSDHAFVGKLIEDLGDVIDGPEHTIDVYLDPTGHRVKRLRLGARLGATDPRVVFSRAVRTGPRVAKWSHVADAVDGGTAFQTRGDAPTGADVTTDAQPMLSDLVERTDLLAAGWPRLDAVEDRPGVTDTATLNGYAQADAAQFGGAAATSGYTVEVGGSGWSPNRIGDAVRIKMSDLWHADAPDVTVRPVGCSVEAPEPGKAEKVTLLLGDED